MTDEQLIQGCLDGDRVAQKALYTRFSSVLMAICFRYAHSRAEAEDLLQDVFVKIYRRIGSFKQKGSFEGWLKRIAVNTAITNYHKNVNRYHQMDIDDVKESDDKFNYESITDQLSAQELLRVISELPPKYKLTFNLYAIEGYSHKEIADMLDISVGTSKSQLSRARKMLQNMLIKVDKGEYARTV